MPTHTPDADMPGWLSTTLRVAGIYNLVWGAAAILFPAAMLSFLGVDAAQATPLWQCLGMVIGVYGVGYWIAGGDPVRHWPITLVGLLGKLFGPIGFIYTASLGQLPWQMGWTILPNDVIWWIPFGLILLYAYRAEMRPRLAENEEDELADSPFDSLLGVDGVSVNELSRERPLLLVFLRHSGCTFCREDLARLREVRGEIEGELGGRIALVHLGKDAAFAELAEHYEMADAPRFVDPEARLYRAAGLERGGPREMFGPEVWAPGFRCAIVEGHGVAMPDGDPFQMPGVLVISNGEILAAHRHTTPADRPDFVGMLKSVAETNREPAPA